MGGFLTSPVGAIAAVAISVAALFRSAMSDAAKLQKMALGADLTTTQAQAVKLASGRAGLEPELLLNVMDLIKQKQGELVGGNKSLAESFAALGYSEEEAIAADPYDMLLRVLKMTKTGEGGVRAFAAAVDVLGRSFRTELATAASQGLGDWITEYEKSDLIASEKAINDLAKRKADENRIATEIKQRLEKAKLEGSATLANEGMFGGLSKEAPAALGMNTEPTGPSEADLLALATARDATAKAKRTADRAAEFQRAKDKEVQQLHLSNAAKAYDLEFKSLTVQEQRTRLLEKQAEIWSQIQQAKTEMEREKGWGAMLETMGALQGLPARSTQATGFSSIGQDQFARMGLYVTGGAQGLAQSQVGLLRAANVKLDAIKGAIDNNTTATRNAFD